MKKMHPIEALIEQGEHQQLDFKFEVSDSKKIARTLSAFANTDGGRLLIGVKDNGNISGVRSEEEYYMIEAASKMYTRPEVPFEATRWEVNGKTVLEVYIAPSSDKPHTAPDKDDKIKAYIRVADENILANEVLVLAWQKKHKPDGTLLKISKPVERLFASPYQYQPVLPDRADQLLYREKHSERSLGHEHLAIPCYRQAYLISTRPCVESAKTAVS